MGKKKRSGKKKIRVWDIIIPTVCLGVIIFCGCNLYRIYESYSEAAEIYDGVSLFVTDKVETEDAVEEERSRSLEEAGFPYLYIDYEGLKDINSDFLGWIYFPLLDISYPVVYGDEDFTYLKTAIDGTASSSGCIFIDCYSDPDIQDWTTLIYGHNMRNGSMFGSLKRIRREEGLIDQDPYFYYYTEEKAYKCRVFSYYLEDDGGKTYSIAPEDYPDNHEGYDVYMDYILSKNEYEGGPESVDLAHRPQIITLSTCSGHNTGKRTVVHGAITDIYEFTD